ncbi:MAG: hypothetical protein OQJ98_02800 [Candidatus Pacebacteria bacterium]|nr:hypothetical protein [Candidatus Paceibacterota bacterium]
MGAIAFLAIIAYPGKGEYHKRDELVEASKSWILKEATQKGSPERAEVYEKYRQYPNQQIDGKLRQLEARVWKRLCVAELARDIIRQHQFATHLPDSLKKSNRELRLKYLDETYATSGSNFDVLQSEKTFRKREWKPSLPILHYAISLLAMVLKGESFSIRDLVLSPDWLPEIIKGATGHALLIDQYIDDDFQRIEIALSNC